MSGEDNPRTDKPYEGEAKEPQSPELSNPRRRAVRLYWERAVFAFTNMHNAKNEPHVRAMLTAFCVHAVQSTTEALVIFAEQKEDESLKASIKSLTYARLIANVRHHDLHGNPIPVCDEERDSFIVLRGKKPMRLTSSNEVGVLVQWEGPRPRVSRSPKDQRNGQFSLGDAITYQCSGGELGVYDAASQETYNLLKVLKLHMLELQEIIESL